MSTRVCPVCGRSFTPSTGSHTVCSQSCRDRNDPDRYGREHRRLRAALMPQVSSGRVACSRCGELIASEDLWDLDHVDGLGPGRGYRGPSHRGCNRATAKRPESYVDDPDRGVFWGPPSLTDGRPVRWSRAWFPWREEVEVSGRYR